MTRTRLALVSVAFVFALLLVARETTSLSINVHSTEMNASQQSYRVVSNHSGDIGLGYDIKLVHRDRTWTEHRRMILGAPRIQIRGELKDIAYTGTDWMPLRKNFTMTYVCELTTQLGEDDDEDAPSMEGSINGEIQVRIVGICSRREARRIALKEAKERIREYVLKMSLE